MGSIKNNDTDHFNIISLDGGGIRGVLEAIILERLEKSIPSLLRDTDLIVGTSTGGIQALGLAAGKKPPEVKELYTKCAEYIFEDSVLDNIKDAGKVLGADYSNSNLRNILKLQFGDRTLGDLEKKVAIVSFDLDNNVKDPSSRTWKPKIFHNCDNSDADLSTRVVDVALYTSAAPTYFPIIDGFIDGGVVANNPTLVGVAQALDSRGPNQDLKSLSLLSLGTGRVNKFIKEIDADWGLAKWAPKILSVLMEGSVDLVHFQAKQILRDKYFRVNPKLKMDIELDDCKAIEELIKIAEREDLSAAIGWLDTYWL